MKSCIRDGDTCYERHCGQYNWYNARTQCKKRTKNLSSNVSSILEHLKKFWFDDDSCQAFWLGVHKEDWYIQSGNKGITKYSL